MSRITTVKDKIPKKASWPGFLASGKDSRTKVVLARILEKQGLGSTPALAALYLPLDQGLVVFATQPVSECTLEFRHK